jgi:hypothetical protein
MLAGDPNGAPGLAETRAAYLTRSWPRTSYGEAMSLWTPDGERKIPPKPAEPEAANPALTDEPELTPEEEEQVRAVAQELAEARARLLETEVAAVLANHAFGIYELAAIHLTAERPKLQEASLAIDALATLVDGLAGRLGENEPTLKHALQQVQLAFVQRTKEAGAAPGA